MSVAVFNNHAAVTIVGSVVLVSIIKLTFPPATAVILVFGMSKVLLICIGKLESDGSDAGPVIFKL